MLNSDQKSKPEGDEDLAFSNAEMAGPSTAVPARASPGWPLALPPRYENQESTELQNLGPPLPTDPPAVQEMPTPGPGDGTFNFGYFKPQRDSRTKFFIGAIIFLLIVVIGLTIALPVVAHKRHSLSPQNTTVFITTTFSTTLVSTQLVSTTRTDDFSFTTTQVSSTTLVSTQLVTTTQTENVSFTETQVSSTTQVTTQTKIVTSLLPNPTSVSKCWDLLNNICANTTQVLPDTHSGTFGDCENILGFFYCGVIQNLEAQHLFIIPVDDSPLCGGMKEFCAGINLGSDPQGLQPVESATKSGSAIQIVPVAPRNMRSMVTNTRGAERQLSKAHRPTRTPGPLPTEVLMAMRDTGR